jgi:hypothetical protein
MLHYVVVTQQDQSMEFLLSLFTRQIIKELTSNFTPESGIFIFFKA